MLPQDRRFFPCSGRVLALGVVLLLAACGSPQSPEAQVRAVIAAGEAAAEARDLSGILENVAPDFRDAQAAGARNCSDTCAATS